MSGGPWDSGGGTGITQTDADARYALIAAGVPTGAVQDYIGAAAPDGWLLWTNASGQLQIGNAASGANLRANADCAALFALIYNAMADAEAPVSGGRGDSAAVDWAANKHITLPDIRGRAAIGSGTGSGLTARTHGAVAGAETHSLVKAELTPHMHSYFAAGGSGAGYNNGLWAVMAYNTGDGAVDGLAGAAHNNMQPWLALHKIIKL